MPSSMFPAGLEDRRLMAAGLGNDLIIVALVHPVVAALVSTPADRRRTLRNLPRLPPTRRYRAWAFPVRGTRVTPDAAAIPVRLVALMPRMATTCLAQRPRSRSMQIPMRSRRRRCCPKCC